MGTNGRIHIPQPEKTSDTEIAINEFGDVSTGTKLLGKLRIVDFEQLNVLRKEGASLFAADIAANPATMDGRQIIIRQGYLEESNVGGIDEMIQLIELTRSFETDQRTVQAQDGTLQKAMDIGRL
jgi:flagellar basal-body rod protein FlgG